MHWSADLQAWLALSLPIRIGSSLIAGELDLHLPKGEIYCAMAICFGVELRNLKPRGRRRAPLKLHHPPRAQRLMPTFLSTCQLRVPLSALALLLAVALPVRAAEEPPPRIELYVTSWCPYCLKAIDFFRERGLAPTIYNIERDPAAARRKEQLDPRRGVPLAVIDGQVIYGYAPRSYQTALDP